MRAQATSFQNKKKTILLIDDDQDQLCIFEALLKKNDYKVVAAESAKDGLNTLRDIVVDIVVCDIFMPQMSGKEFVSLVRKLNGFEDVPVIALTAGGEDLEAEMREAGADNFCPKNMASARLPGQIEALV